MAFLILLYVKVCVFFHLIFALVTILQIAVIVIDYPIQSNNFLLYSFNIVKWKYLYIFKNVTNRLKPTKLNKFNFKPSINKKIWYCLNVTDNLVMRTQNTAHYCKYNT